MNPNTLLKKCDIDSVRHLGQKQILIEKGYSEDYIQHIIRTDKSGNRVKVLIDLHDELIKKINLDQIKKIAIGYAGAENLKAVNKHYEALILLGFGQEQIYNMALSMSAAKNFEVIKEHAPDLLKNYDGMSCNQIVQIASCRSAFDKLKFLAMHHSILTRLPFEKGILVIAIQDSKCVASLQLLIREYDLLKEKCTPAEIVTITRSGCLAEKIEELKSTQSTQSALSELELQIGYEPLELSYQVLIDTGVYFFKPYPVKSHTVDKRRPPAELQEEHLPPRKVNP